MSKALENPVPQRRHSACDQWILITTTSVRLEPSPGDGIFWSGGYLNLS